MSTSRGKVLVAMSGGVDSSVAAALLARDGYEVVGCFMRLGSPGETLDPPEEACDASGKTRIGKQGCCSVGDAADARLVAAQLNAPFYVVNFKNDFGRIIDYFVGEYAAGRTPNPCVRCNDWLKFGKLHEYARQIGAKAVASGHYARVERPPGSAERSPSLLRGIDHEKDQSYVLFGAPRERLGEMMLPIGGYRKSTVREMAADFGLPVFDKPDSQEICFVPDNDYAGLVERRRPDLAAAGPILTRDGQRLGQHAGHHRYTIGQRRGIGVAADRPLYVLDRDPSTNAVVVGPRESLAAAGLVAAETNWLITDDEIRSLRSTPRRAEIQFRAHAEPASASIEIDAQNQLVARFDEPLDAVAPGQAAVCYEGDRVLGGGWIRRAIPAG
jgi:tRNA-uridine 2-sulfurtransferase